MGALAIMNPKVASIGLDLTRRAGPVGIRLERTRELGRLAILRHQASPAVLVGLLLEALSWGCDHDVNHFFAAANASFANVLRALAPSMRTLETAEDQAPNPIRDRYLRKTHEVLGPLSLVTFDVDRTAPTRLLWRLLTWRLPRLTKPAERSFWSRLQLVRS